MTRLLALLLLLFAVPLHAQHASDARPSRPLSGDGDPGAGGAQRHRLAAKRL